MSGATYCVIEPKNGHTTWAYSVELGRHHRQVCSGCGFKQWVNGRRKLGCCPRCEGQLEETYDRRQEQKHGFGSREAADAAGRERATSSEVQALRGGGPSLAAFAWDVFFPWHAQQHPEGSYEYARTESNLRRHILPPLGALAVVSLTTALLQEWYEEMAAERSLSSAKNVAYTLRKLLAYAVAKGVAPHNVAQRIIIRSDKPRQPDLMDAAELQELQRALDTGSECDQVMLLCLETAMWQGELLALRTDDIDHEGGVIRVRRTLQGPYARGSIKLRSVPLTAEAASLLERIAPSPGFIFGGLNDRQACQRMKNLRKRNERPKWTFTCVRRSLTASALRRGWGIDAVSAMSGLTVACLISHYHAYLPDPPEGAALAVSQVFA